MLKQMRIPPQSIEAEHALLGSIMLRPDAIHEIMDIVGAPSFYAEKNRIVWQTMMELFAKTTPIDLLSLSSRLKEKGLLESVGGASFLTELVSSVPSSTNAKHYAEIVQKKYMMRRLIEAAEHISELGFHEAGELEDLLDQAEKKMFEVTNYSGVHKFIELKDTLIEAWDRLDRLHRSRDELRGVPTGFKELDNKLAGFQKSDLIILAARPSMGKTSLALDIARKSAIGHSIPVGIFSLEMSSQQLVDRMLAAESNVDAWKLRTGRLSIDSEFDNLRQSLDKLSKAPIFIDDQPGNNILKMRAISRRLKSEKGLGLIIVDYLQLMVPTNTRASDSMVQQVTEISRSLKNLARELDVPVLALSQLSRAVEQRGGKPRLSDLRDSGCLSGDTNVIRADTGERVPIKSLVGQKNIPVFSLNSEYRLEKRVVSKVFSTGIKKLYALETRSGRIIKATANHKFFTLSGWQRLDELSYESCIALPRRINANVSRKQISTEEATLLAHLLGDGCILPKQPFHYTSADESNISIVAKTAEHLFGIKSRLVKQKNWWHLYLPSPYRLSRKKRHPITKWFTSMDIALSRAPQKKIPDVIFKSSDEIIRHFLHHLWATDGNISRKRLPGRKPSACIYYSSTSRELALGVQHLLLRLGIWSSIRTVPQGNHRPSFQVHVESSPVQLSFLRQIGSYGKRGEIVPALIEALEEIEHNTNTDIIPKEVWKLIIEPAKEHAGLSWRGLAQKMGIAYNGSALFASALSRPRLSKIASILCENNLKHLVESDVYWDKIVSIKPLGEEEVFDATVPDTHNFVAEDIIVHNSIEQDADVVMFIHRDQNEDGGGRQNVAEILIEKHRNGPTGKVELYFDDKKSTFQSLEKSDFGDFAEAGQEAGAL